MSSYAPSMNNADRFSIPYIMKENILDETSILRNEKFYNSLTEAETFKVMDRVTGKTLGNSRKRLEYLNRRKVFGDIPQTRGVVSKSSYYKDLKKGLSFIETTVIRNSFGASATETRDVYQILKFGLENLEKNSSYFTRAYDENDSNGILLYQSVYSLIIAGTAILIINSTEINEDCEIKYRDFKPGLLKNNKGIQSIDRFNDICRNKKLPEIRKFNEIMEQYDDEAFENLLEDASDVASLNQNFGDKFKAGVSAVFNPIKTYKKANTPAKKAAAIGLIAMGAFVVTALAIYVARSAIAIFFYMKNTVADDARYISGMVEANSYANNMNTNKTREKQRKLSAWLNKFGQELDSDYKQACHQAANQLEKEDRDISKNPTKDLKSGNTIEAVKSTGSGSTVADSSDDLFI